VGDIIKKDIAVKNNLTDDVLLEDFFMLLAQRSGSILSVNKIANVLGISPDTASRYLKMFESVYLIHLMPKYGKPNQKILNPKKLYLPDTGLKTMFSDNPSLGSLFENYIYLRLKKVSPYYMIKNGVELDFFVYPDTVMEVKYNHELEGKQKKVYDAFEAKNKLVVKGFGSLGEFSELLALLEEYFS